MPVSIVPGLGPIATCNSLHEKRSSRPQCFVFVPCYDDLETRHCVGRPPLHGLQFHEVATGQICLDHRTRHRPPADPVLDQVISQPHVADTPLFDGRHAKHGAIARRFGVRDDDLKVIAHCLIREVRRQLCKRMVWHRDGHKFQLFDKQASIFGSGLGDCRNNPKSASCSKSWRAASIGVRRQGFWDQWGPKPRESLAHLICLIMRHAGGDASGALRVFSV